jgi:four helix bundle protein
MQNYKDLKVWTKSHEITLKIYSLTKGFPKEEIYSLTSQIRRCSASIPANIAEGCGKSTNKDFGRFLNIALGSANETEYFLLLSKDLSYIKNEDHLTLEKGINEIKAMLISLIQKVRA